MWKWLLIHWPWVSKKKYDAKCKAYACYVGYCETKDDEILRLKKYLALEVFPKWDGVFIVRDPIVKIFCENTGHEEVRAEIPLDKYAMNVRLEIECFGNPVYIKTTVLGKLNSLVHYIQGQWREKMGKTGSFPGQ